MLLQDLMADLKSELSGSLAKLILGLMLTPAQYDAKQLRKAVEVIVTLLVAQGGNATASHAPGSLPYGEENTSMRTKTWFALKTCMPLCSPACSASW